MEQQEKEASIRYRKLSEEVPALAADIASIYYHSPKIYRLVPKIDYNNLSWQNYEYIVHTFCVHSGVVLKSLLYSSSNSGEVMAEDGVAPLPVRVSASPFSMVAIVGSYFGGVS